MPDSLSEAIEAARAAAATRWGELSGAEAMAACEAATVLVGLAESIRAGALSRVDSSAEFRADGHVSAAAWLQSACRVKPAVARRAQRLGRAVRTLPAVAEAWADGRIGPEQVEVLAGAAAEVPAAVADAEGLLVEAAATMRFAGFERQVRTFVDRCDPDGADQRGDDLVAGRELHASPTTDGRGRIDGWLDPLGFAAFHQELDRLEHELFDAEWTAARDRLGREPLVAELDRTPAQRRADALVEMAGRSRSFVGRTGPAFCVNLHLSWGTWFAELARLEGRTDVAFPEDHLCELDDGTVIPPSLAVSAGLAGWVRRCVLGPDDEVLSFGRARRLFTRVQRQAIIATARSCTFEGGCDRPATECEMDHRQEWEDGGPTDVANGAPLCPAHNRHKHRSKHPVTASAPDTS